MKIHVLFTLCFNDKNLYDNPQIFYFLLFLLAFTSADIIFHKFLELHSTSDKKIFVTNFPFLTNSFKPPPLPHPPPLP